MKELYLIFLEALKAALQNEDYSFPKALTVAEWNRLYQISAKHNVLPLIFNATYKNRDNGLKCSDDADEAAKEKNQLESLLANMKNQVIQKVMLQTIKTDLFLSIYRELVNNGIKPIVVKGIVCRNLYPEPDYRPSSDEDILIDPEEFKHVKSVLAKIGVTPLDENLDTQNAYEVPFIQKGTPVYIEVHKHLFAPDSQAYGELNRYFSDIKQTAVSLDVNGVEISTLDYTDHLFYLLCHAYKHFLHSGFGIRQVCDIILYANHYGRDINWDILYKQCSQINALKFAAAIFKIGENYLSFEPLLARYPSVWSDIQVNEGELLDDLLEAGVFGGASMSRKHSSNITLHAVMADKQGKETNHLLGTLKSAFPGAADLSGRYPYLKQKPYLLPAAWLDRIVKYMSGKNEGSAAKSISIGERRTALLKEYEIIGKHEPAKHKPAKNTGQPDTAARGAVRYVDTGEYVSVLRELTEEGREVSMIIAGNSMSPFLIHQRDVIFFEKPKRKLRRGDMVFFQRSNGMFVMHRIYKIKKDGYYIVGDAQQEIEGPIKRNQIFAVITKVKRKGKMIGPGNFWWWFFEHPWLTVLPLRRRFVQAYSVLRRLEKSIKRLVSK